MIGGQRPKPRALKVLHNTDRPSRRRNEPEAAPGAMIPSPAMLQDPLALEFWNEAITGAHPGLLCPIDRPLLEEYAFSLAIAARARAHLRETGEVIFVGEERDEAGKVTKAGAPKQNPWLAIRTRQVELARKLAGELGLPVSSRARLDLPEILPPPQAHHGGGRPRLTFRQHIANNPQLKRP